MLLVQIEGHLFALGFGKLLDQLRLLERHLFNMMFLNAEKMPIRPMEVQKSNLTQRHNRTAKFTLPTVGTGYMMR